MAVVIDLTKRIAEKQRIENHRRCVMAGRIHTTSSGKEVFVTIDKTWQQEPQPAA